MKRQDEASKTRHYLYRWYCPTENFHRLSNPPRTPLLSPTTSWRGSTVARLPLISKQGSDTFVPFAPSQDRPSPLRQLQWTRVFVWACGLSSTCSVLSCHYVFPRTTTPYMMSDVSEIESCERMITSCRSIDVVRQSVGSFVKILYPKIFKKNWESSS